MNVINPSVEYFPQGNTELAAKEHVAKCASICYQSGEKKGEKAEKFYNALISSNHVSTLRHESCYYIVTMSKMNLDGDDGYLCDYFFDGRYDSCPYINIKKDGDIWYVSTNANFLLDNKHFASLLVKWKVTPEEFFKECPELMRFTFCLTTQISTTRELNRCAGDWGISEMSTRYIKFGGKVEPSIVRPHWLTTDLVWVTDFNKYLGGAKRPIKVEEDYLQNCINSFASYENLLQQGIKPQDARGVLPLDTLSKVVYTGSLKVWSHVLQLRLLDTTGKAHGNCHVICDLVYKEFQKLGYKFNENNELVYETRRIS